MGQRHSTTGQHDAGCCVAGSVFPAFRVRSCCVSLVPIADVHSAYARFYAGAVQLANLGALTRIILSGVLLSKF